MTFFGVFDPDGFESLAHTTESRSSPGLTSSTLTMDRLQYEAAAVPEPMALVLTDTGQT